MDMVVRLSSDDWQSSWKVSCSRREGDDLALWAKEAIAQAPGGTAQDLVLRGYQGCLDTAHLVREVIYTHEKIADRHDITE